MANQTSAVFWAWLKISSQETSDGIEAIDFKEDMKMKDEKECLLDAEEKMSDTMDDCKKRYSLE